jgi:hypothetical protein
MKKLKPILFLFGTLMAFNTLMAQTVDEIIDKYTTAMGGKEKMMSLNSFRMEGNLNVQGTDVSLIVTRQHLVGSRADISVMGTENYQICTPTKGWVFMPVQGQSAPEEMADDQFKASLNQLDLQGPFLNYKEKGNTIELAGKEKLDSGECFKLKVTYKNGSKTDYWINSKTYRIDKTSAKVMVNGEEMDVATTYSNYKQNADGYWFAYTTSSIRGETNFDKVDTNIKVDESIFKAK